MRLQAVCHSPTVVVPPELGAGGQPGTVPVTTRLLDMIQKLV